MANRILILLTAVILSAILFVDLSGNKFRRRIQQDEQRILAAAKSGQKTVQFEDLGQLPAPVQKYLKYSLRNGQKHVNSVRIKQAGEFRLKEADNWVAFEAVQHITAIEPSFVWHARLQPLPYVWTEARDLFHRGSADTVNRLFGAVPVSFASGRENDVSGLVRFLAETPWIPTVLLPGLHIDWQGINADSARAFLNSYGYRVAAVFTFNDTGEIIKISTEDRYRTIEGKKERHPWTVHYRQYRTIQGMRIPTEIETEWTVQGRTFPNTRFKVTDIQYIMP